MIPQEHTALLRDLLKAAERNDGAAYTAGLLKFVHESHLLPATRPVTLWEPDKVRTVLSLVLATEGVRGDIVELGVFRGGGTLLIAEMLRAFSSTRKITGIDSFQGLPQESPEDTRTDGQVIYTEGKFRDESNYARTGFVMKFFGVEQYVNLVKGFFDDVLPEFIKPEDKYSLVIIDPDQYKGTMDALTAFYDHVSPGGYILIDDYYSTAAVGVAKAADEFLADKPETIYRGGVTMAYFQKQ